jgi:hypothetical protein
LLKPWKSQKCSKISKEYGKKLEIYLTNCNFWVRVMGVYERSRMVPFVYVYSLLSVQ